MRPNGIYNNLFIPHIQVAPLLHSETHMCWPLFSIQSRPAYTGGQLMETTWPYKNWTVHYNLWKTEGLGCKNRKKVEQTTDSSAN
jgi:hypothetical protein